MTDRTRWLTAGTICMLVVAAFTVPSVLTGQTKKQTAELHDALIETPDGPVEIVVGKGNVTVIVPHIARKDLQDLVVTFFSRGDVSTRQWLGQVFSQTSEVTLVMTTALDGRKVVEVPK